MSTLQDAEKLLAAMSRAEKTQLLQRIIRDLGDTHPRIDGIEITAGVCGGAACIAGTRIPVWILEQYRRLGASEAELLRSYPALRAEDLVNAWSYVSSHQNEIEQQIQENEAT